MRSLGEEGLNYYMNKFLCIVLLLAGCVSPKQQPPERLAAISTASTPVLVIFQGEVWQVMGYHLQLGFVILHLGIRYPYGVRTHCISQTSVEKWL